MPVALVAGVVVEASIYRNEGVVVEYNNCMAACHRISLTRAVSPLKEERRQASECPERELVRLREVKGVEIGEG